jgi:leucyl aminopeptidase
VTLPTLEPVCGDASSRFHPEADLLGVAVFQEQLGDWDTGPLSGLDQALAGNLKRSCEDERFRAKLGTSVVLQTNGALSARRLVLMGAGPLASASEALPQHLGAGIVRLANRFGARHIIMSCPPLPNANAPAWLEGLARGAALGSYRFDKYRTAEGRDSSTLESVRLAVAAEHLDVAGPAIARARRVAAAVAHARDLVNEPAVSLTPRTLASGESARAQSLGLDATVLGPAECQTRGMGLFLAVARGSAEEPRFLHLAWRPENPVARVVLVGKGVTFDSGGLSLKTNEGMQDMKSDMAGAAAVCSAIGVVAEEKLPVEVHALCACTENMPSGNAYRLGDVLRSMSGRTVEINNTDAEGRLTMADALTYGLELRPDVMLDFATLTGACMVALGPYTAGVMSNDEGLAADWLAAARAAGEDMWRLPLTPRLFDQLKSEIADMRNTGERWGGALTAGLFLKEFVGTTPWVHVDLAGPATADKEWGVTSKGGTGFGVATIVQYLRTLAARAVR